MWRALIYGCIPVTYFRAVELPFMRRLGIDYGQFSVNIQPDDYDTTQVRRASLTLVSPTYGRFYCLSVTCNPLTSSQTAKTLRRSACNRTRRHT